MPLRCDETLKRALMGDRTPKFLATRSRAGQPNCVPITTITPYDADTLVFGEFMMNKSRKNLDECSRVSVAVMTNAFEAWSLAGTFLGFETSGKYVDLINQSPLFRYNAYTSIRSAGVIRVEGQSSRRAPGKIRVLADFARLSARALLPIPGGEGPVRMPRPVMEIFSRLSAVRAVAHLKVDGSPTAFAMMACIPAGPARLLLSDAFFRAHEQDFVPGMEMAVAVITQDPIAYQVKGVYQGRRGGLGVVEIRECYSASPPLCGERLT